MSDKQQQQLPLFPSETVATPIPIPPSNTVEPISPHPVSNIPSVSVLPSHIWAKSTEAQKFVEDLIPDSSLTQSAIKMFRQECKKIGLDLGAEIKVELRRSNKKPAYIRIWAPSGFNKKLALSKMLRLVAFIPNSPFSQKYLAHKVEYNGSYIPVVIANGDNKKNITDSIIQKQLTPFKLGLVGTVSVQDLYRKLRSGIEDLTLDINPTWLQENKKYKAKDLKNLLLRLSRAILGGQVPFSAQDKLLLQNHASSLSRDFGEVLAALYVVQQRRLDCIEFPLTEANPEFDFSYKEQGKTYRINVKSGSGSGQNFQIMAEPVNELIKKNCYASKSPEQIMLTIMGVFTSSTNAQKSGADKIFQMANCALAFDNQLGALLEKIKKEFFQDKEISALNYINNFSYLDFQNKILELYKEVNLRPRGLNKNKTPEIEAAFNAHPQERKNAMVFLLGTVVCNYMDKEKSEALLDSLLSSNDLSIIHVDISEDKISMTVPPNPKYRFHYWSNYSKPTNNLPGFKAFYDPKEITVLQPAQKDLYPTQASTNSLCSASFELPSEVSPMSNKAAKSSSKNTTT